MTAESSTNIDPALPLIDLHRHLDGSLRLETVIDLGRRHNVELPAGDVAGLRPHVVVEAVEPDVMAFIARFKWLTAVLVDTEACRRVAYENVEDARSEGIDYIELRFSPLFMAETHGLEPEAVVEAVIDGVEAAARDTGQRVHLIGTLSRTYGTVKVSQELEALLRFGDHLVAVDLAGDEINFPVRLFVEHFRRVREAGLGVTVHAGESAGAASVWSAIRDLGATRIGHAIRAGEDPALLEHLVEQRIGVEANLTSNVQTCSVASYAEHPLASQLALGILATINTDDPTISGIDLRHEYQIAAPRAGLSRGQIRQAQTNGLEIAFLSPEERADLRRRCQERRRRAPGPE